MTEEDAKIIQNIIDGEKDALEHLSMEIWKNPEYCFKEVFAHSILTEALEKYGFEVTRSYILPTAFRAEYSRGRGPTVAVMCEYDALPSLGHACGHNLISETGVATAIGIKAAMEADVSLKGKIVVLGTPAEEGGGGKIRLIDAGAFNDIDAALMAHPSRRNLSAPIHSCRAKINVTFRGKAAHASAFPWQGLNALDAAVGAYVSIGILRQQIKPTYRIHGVITKGGTACNVIPEETELRYFVRTPTEKELFKLRKRVELCFEGAAKATGCEVEFDFEEDNVYLNLISNQVMVSLYKKYSEALGVEFVDDEMKNDKLAGGGSSDAGNVSYVVPTLHPIFQTGQFRIHTKEFVDQAATSFAHEATRITAKALALTAVQLMRSPDFMQQAKDAFREDIKFNKHF